MRPGRSHGCPVMSEKDTKREGREEIDEIFDSVSGIVTLHLVLQQNSH